MSEPDKSRSIEEIEDDYWGDPPADATRLISTAHALRKRSIGALGVEGLRLLISQQIGLDALVPLALEQVERHPLAEGDFYHELACATWPKRSIQTRPSIFFCTQRAAEFLSR